MEEARIFICTKPERSVAHEIRRRRHRALLFVTVGALALSAGPATASWFGCVETPIPPNCTLLGPGPVHLMPPHAYLVRYPTCGFLGSQSTSLLLCLPSDRTHMDRALR